MTDTKDERAVEAVAWAMLEKRFGAESVATMRRPVPDDYPLAEEARRVIAQRIRDTKDAARAAIAAYRDHLKAEGMVIVPGEPTTAMWNAGALKKTQPLGSAAADIYRAMIKAHEGE